jgi:hypothetical protein
MIERRPRRHMFGEEGESGKVDRTIISTAMRNVPISGWKNVNPGEHQKFRCQQTK